jgi:hypothetical protein
MSVVDVLLGKPLATSDERAEQIGAAAGIPIFGLDALSSAAYGPEAALTLLIPLGAAGVAYILPVSLSIIALLATGRRSQRIPAAGARTRWLRKIWADFRACWPRQP